MVARIRTVSPYVAYLGRRPHFSGFPMPSAKPQHEMPIYWYCDDKDDPTWLYGMHGPQSPNAIGIGWDGSDPMPGGGLNRHTDQLRLLHTERKPIPYTHAFHVEWKIAGHEGVFVFGGGVDIHEVATGQGRPSVPREQKKDVWYPRTWTGPGPEHRASQSYVGGGFELGGGKIIFIQRLATLDDGSEQWQGGLVPGDGTWLKHRGMPGIPKFPDVKMFVREGHWCFNPFIFEGAEVNRQGFMTSGALNRLVRAGHAPPFPFDMMGKVVDLDASPFADKGTDLHAHEGSHDHDLPPVDEEPPVEPPPDPDDDTEVCVGLVARRLQLEADLATARAQAALVQAQIDQTNAEMHLAGCAHSLGG